MGGLPILLVCITGKQVWECSWCRTWNIFARIWKEWKLALESDDLTAKVISTVGGSTGKTRRTKSVVSKSQQKVDTLCVQWLVSGPRKRQMKWNMEAHGKPSVGGSRKLLVKFSFTAAQSNQSSRLFVLLVVKNTMKVVMLHEASKPDKSTLYSPKHLILYAMQFYTLFICGALLRLNTAFTLFIKVLLYSSVVGCQPFFVHVHAVEGYLVLESEVIIHKEASDL